MAANDNHPRAIGFTKMMELPAMFGRVTKLKNVNGKVVAETSSGKEVVVRQNEVGELLFSQAGDPEKW